jgi:hypothetical protein
MSADVLQTTTAPKEKEHTDADSGAEHWSGR